MRWRHVLQWLRVPERVLYKIAVLTFKVLHNSEIKYAPFHVIAQKWEWQILKK